MSYLSDVTSNVTAFVNKLPDKVLHKWYDKLSVYSRSDLVDAIETSSSTIIYDLFTEANILKISFPKIRHVNDRELSPSGGVVRNA
jgi:hypothetical protein